jgi:hypothetical protein
MKTKKIYFDAIHLIICKENLLQSHEQEHVGATGWESIITD